MKTIPLLVLGLILSSISPSFADYSTWSHSGSLYLLTTPEGANLPESASVENFPVLVRLHKDFFPFHQTQANGADLRFSTSIGEPLAYQIEQWDAANGQASIWVRVPKIQGNARQEIKVHWGKSDAKSESNGKAVFNESNGYLSVLHMDESVADAVGSVETKDVGTTAVAGMIGPARHFSGKQGVFCGEKNVNFPVGASSHSSEVWLRAEKTNGRALAWGNEHGQGKVIMHFVSPPHVNMECYFSGANVSSEGRLPMHEWIHIMHTYQQGDSRIYVNGELSKVSQTPNAPLAIKTPARFYIGGWYNNYDFVGDMDEVRISKVVRSAEWIKLQYANQQSMQTLVGPLVMAGNEFSVDRKMLAIAEGKSVNLTAKAGGAQKIYWTLKRQGQEKVVATDRLTYSFAAWRVVGDETCSLQFKAIYPTEVKTVEIPITIQEDIPEPAFTLSVPATWGGRERLEITPQITNLAAMKAKGADALSYQWTLSGIAVINETSPGKLILKRAQNSGTLVIKLAVNNGGASHVFATSLTVKEPARDAWVERTPEQVEKPEDNQFYARNDKNEGTLHYNGILPEKADQVFLKLYADDKLMTNETQKPKEDLSYAFAMKLKPGLTKYRVEFGTKAGEKETIQHTATNLVCGDAYLINGQSNAVATDFGKEDPAFRSDWIRSYGSMSGSPQGVRIWGNAVHRSRDAEKLQIGYWGMELAQRIVEGQKMPVCIINGAVGGTRIDQHQRNPENPEDMTTIYGRLLWRVRQAKLTHGIRGVLWHQGENDQGADGPTGGYGWETCQQYFVDMSAAWKEDYPNIQNYYLFQIWPKSCAMGINGSDNRLREVQRNLPNLYSNMSIMSTLGIKPPGGCHFPAAGYAEFAKLIGPLVERDSYAVKQSAQITAANLKRAYFASDKREELVLEFTQPIAWSESLVSQFYLDGQAKQVIAGAAQENMLRLQLKEPSSAKTITYLDSANWSPDNLLYGTNGIAALTFCEVAIEPKK